MLTTELKEALVEKWLVYLSFIQNCKLTFLYYHFHCKSVNISLFYGSEYMMTNPGLEKMLLLLLFLHHIHTRKCCFCNNKKWRGRRKKKGVFSYHKILCIYVKLPFCSFYTLGWICLTSLILLSMVKKLELIRITWVHLK